jgi:hypothetical protein
VKLFQAVGLLGRNMLRWAATAATSIIGIKLEHVARPRVDTLNGKTERPPVNETKPALFLPTGNERFAAGAHTGRFAMMTARAAARGAKFAAAQRTSHIAAE